VFFEGEVGEKLTCTSIVQCPMSTSFYYKHCCIL